MYSVPKPPRPVGGFRAWLMPGLLCLVVVGAGIVLPQLLPSPASSKTTKLTSIPVEKQEKASASKSDDLAYVPPEWPEPPDTAGMMTRLMLGTIAVLGLCLTSLWLGKRWLVGGTRQVEAGKRLQVVETLRLGNRAFLHLVKAGSVQVVIGTDQTGFRSAVLADQPFEKSLETVERLARPAAT
jgi:flagellar biogenesis protein FliO